MWFYDFRCDRCRRQENAFIGVLAYYQLDDGRKLYCFERPVWCYSCEGIRCAERLPETDWIESQIREFKDSGLDNELLKSMEALNFDSEDFLTERQDGFHMMLDWRLARESPPRCWDCGSTDFVALALESNDEPKPFIHPSCGGQFECEWAGHALQAERRLFDSEGFEIKS